MSEKNTSDDAKRDDDDAPVREGIRDDTQEVALSDTAVSADGEVYSTTVRRSDITNRHDAGSGANETIDGLASMDEAVRQAAEDVPTGGAERPVDTVPVFDRGRMPPKV